MVISDLFWAGYDRNSYENVVSLWQDLNRAAASYENTFPIAHVLPISSATTLSQHTTALIYTAQAEDWFSHFNPAWSNQSFSQ
jgi:hypothetical protein